MWHNLQSDSFAMAWPLLLRCWIGLGGGSSDQALRVLGLVLGLGGLASLWFGARGSIVRVPVLGLAIFALQSAVVCYGDSIRGYGLGMLGGMLTIALLWRATQFPSIRWWLLSLLAALVAVHTLFHNAPVLFAACVAASVVLAMQGNWTKIALPMGIGVICALSLLPYTLTLGSTGQWVSIFRYPITPAWFWYKLQEAFGQTPTLVFDLWIGLVLLGFVTTLSLVFRAFRQRISPDRLHLLVFSSITLALGVAGHFAFLWKLSYYMQPWYFLASLSIVGATIDGVLVGWGPIGNRFRLYLAAMLLICCPPSLMAAAGQAKTNMNLVAARIQQADSPGDLIIVNQWWMGYSFRLNYKGPATWTCVPPIEFPAFPGLIRLTALKDEMQHPSDAMTSVLKLARATLKSGHRVWLVGEVIAPDPQTPLTAPPPYQDQSPQKDGAYYNFWAAQLGQLLGEHATEMQAVAIQSSRPVSSYEDEPLHLCWGWKD
jgi:hypothetical protein